MLRDTLGQLASGWRTWAARLADSCGSSGCFGVVFVFAPAHRSATEGVVDMALPRSPSLSGQNSKTLAMTASKLPSSPLCGRPDHHGPEGSIRRAVPPMFWERSARCSPRISLCRRPTGHRRVDKYSKKQRPPSPDLLPAGGFLSRGSHIWLGREAHLAASKNSRAWPGHMT